MTNNDPPSIKSMSKKKSYEMALSKKRSILYLHVQDFHQLHRFMKYSADNH